MVHGGCAERAIPALSSTATLSHCCELWAGLAGPRPEHTAYDHQLAQMVRSMVRHQQQLPQVRLICSSRNFSGQIYFGIQGLPLQGFAVATERGDTFIPGSRRRWGSGLRPVIIRPAAFLVLGLDAELQDVFLGDAKVLEQLPGRVGKTRGNLPAKVGRKSGNNLVEAGMCVLPVEQTRKARADLRALLRNRSPCLGTTLCGAQVRLHGRPPR